MSTSFFYRQRGFTIVELIIVVTIIGILATIVVFSYNGVQASAKDKVVLSDIDGVASEAARYQVKNSGVFSADGSGSAITWYSGGDANDNIVFTPSSGTVIDLVANDTEYCVRGYNTAAATYKTIASAATKGSTDTACTTLSASTDAVADSP